MLLVRTCWVTTSLQLDFHLYSRYVTFFSTRYCYMYMHTVRRTTLLAVFCDSEWHAINILSY